MIVQNLVINWRSCCSYFELGYMKLTQAWHMTKVTIKAMVWTRFNRISVKNIWDLLEEKRAVEAFFSNFIKIFASHFVRLLNNWTNISDFFFFFFLENVDCRDIIQMIAAYCKCSNINKIFIKRVTALRTKWIYQICSCIFLTAASCISVIEVVRHNK